MKIKTIKEKNIKAYKKYWKGKPGMAKLTNNAMDIILWDKDQTKKEHFNVYKFYDYLEEYEKIVWVEAKKKYGKKHIGYVTIKGFYGYLGVLWTSNSEWRRYKIPTFVDNHEEKTQQLKEFFQYLDNYLEKQNLNLGLNGTYKETFATFLLKCQNGYVEEDKRREIELKEKQFKHQVQLDKNKKKGAGEGVVINVITDNKV